jgi:hypothetical protein
VGAVATVAFLLLVSLSVLAQPEGGGVRAGGPGGGGGGGGGSGVGVTDTFTNVRWAPIALLVVVVFLVWKFRASKSPSATASSPAVAASDSTNGEKPSPPRMVLGITLTVLGGGGALWVFSRVTSVLGKFHTWEPPFSDYEVSTLVGAGIAAFLVIAGLVCMVRREPPRR